LLPILKRADRYAQKLRKLGLRKTDLPSRLDDWRKLDNANRAKLSYLDVLYCVQHFLPDITLQITLDKFLFALSH